MAKAAKIVREARARADEERERRVQAHEERPLHRRLPTREAKLLNEWGRAEWQTRWERAKRRIPGQHRATTWRAPWTQETRLLYDGLTKAEATALFLMRTEVIGLNAWLAAIRVWSLPSLPMRVACADRTTRPAPLHEARESGPLEKVRIGRLEEILQRPSSAKHAARWLVH